MTILLDGQKKSESMKQELAAKVSSFSQKPHLLIVRVGNDEASKVYVEKKQQYGDDIGVQVTITHLEEEVETAAVQKVIQEANESADINGIILQLPIPAHLHKEFLVNSISPEKDVDGLTARNMWRLMDDDEGIIPATARGIELLLEEHSISLEGKHVVIVGDSLLVGKSTAIHFLNKNATVTVCHDKTENLSSFTKQADIVVTAVGKEGLITKDHVKPESVVIDVGIVRNGENKIVGDVSFDDVSGFVHAVTPVPGGVGPMTVASLFQNIVDLVDQK